MKKSNNKSESKIILPEHYSSIDYLPVLKWDKINKNGDVSALLVKPAVLTEKERKALQEVWVAIYNEFVSVFGFGEDFNTMTEKQIYILKLKLKKIIKKDDSIQNFIRAEEIKLEAVKARLQNAGGDIYKAKRAIEKELGIYIPLKEISVREFYSYMKDLNKKKS